MRKNLIIFLITVASSFQYTSTNARKPQWGFMAHRLINRQAILLLPDPLRAFYLPYLQQITRDATRPDQRRYAMAGEGPRHFIDLDGYPPHLLHPRPIRWDSLPAYLSPAQLEEMGILPWHLRRMRSQLISAFAKAQVRKIVLITTDLGHYLADANVPLHTTSNYNGQKTGQTGIHGLWESRLPELYVNGYDLFLSPPKYEPDLDLLIWNHILRAQLLTTEVLSLELEANTVVSENRKFVMEKRGSTLVRTYSREFCEVYHELLDGMVEQQMKQSILLIATFVYTCWVDAGMPDL